VGHRPKFFRILSIALLASAFAALPILNSRSIGAPAQTPIVTRPLLEPKAVGADWQQILSLRSKPVRSYLTAGTPSMDQASIEKDMALYLVEAKRLKLFPDVPGFREW
jgi:hypothetical protein